MKVEMKYIWYKEDIVQRYGIELRGWTFEKIMNPTLLSSSLPPLMALRDALVAGTCKFVKLTAAQRKEREAAYMEKINSGEIEAWKRKQRSDAGTVKKSKRARPEVDAANDGTNSAHKTQEFIEDSDADESSD